MTEIKENLPQYMWAPWRMEYILCEKPKGCVLCEDYKKHSDEERFILKRGKYSFVIMNYYPYNNGHLMICPYKHTDDYISLSAEVKHEMQELITESIAVLKKVMSPTGFNIGMNMGTVAGAGIADHLHWHVVPRWNGDTNFMPVINHTRVLPEALHETWKKLKEAFDLYH